MCAENFTEIPSFRTANHDYSIMPGRVASSSVHYLARVAVDIDGNERLGHQGRGFSRHPARSSIRRSRLPYRAAVRGTRDAAARLDGGCRLGDAIRTERGGSVNTFLSAI